MFRPHALAIAIAGALTSAGAVAAAGLPPLSATSRYVDVEEKVGLGGNCSLANPGVCPFYDATSYDGSAQSLLTASGAIPDGLSVEASASAPAPFTVFFTDDDYTAKPPYLQFLQLMVTVDETFHFTVTGPSPATVPLAMDYQIRTMGVGGSDQYGARVVTSADARVGYYASAGADQLSSLGAYVGTESTATTDSRAGRLLFGVATDRPAFGELDAYVEVQVDADGSGETAAAYADPVISIDPTWAAEHPGYSLVFGSGFTNGASPAPEPAGWAMALAGMAGVGGALRRRAASGRLAMAKA